MKIQRVLLRVRAASVQGFSQVEMDLPIFSKRHDAICNQTIFSERHVVRHDGDHFIHHQRIVGGCEPRFKICGLYQINGLSSPGLK